MTYTPQRSSPLRYSRTSQYDIWIWEIHPRRWHAKIRDAIYAVKELNSILSTVYKKGLEDTVALAVGEPVIRIIEGNLADTLLQIAHNL